MLDSREQAHDKHMIWGSEASPSNLIAQLATPNTAVQGNPYVIITLQETLFAIKSLKF
jgi:hypothetical protein